MRDFFLMYPAYPHFFAGHECKFEFAADNNGVVRYLATNGNTELPLPGQAVENPHINGRVISAMSSIYEYDDGRKGGDPSHLVQLDGNTENSTKNEAHSWVSVDLGEGCSLVLSDYCFHHGGKRGSGYRLQSWDFEGSNDDSSYTVLKAHNNDNSLHDNGGLEARHAGTAHSPETYRGWKVEGVKQAYRYFRIRQTGENSFGNHRLCCAGIELYGMLQSR
jgi:hypothetical protein